MCLQRRLLDSRLGIVLVLPNFKNSACIYFQACGALSKGAALDAREMVARYKTGSGYGYLHCITGGEFKEHFHFDVALHAFFRKSAPSITSTRKEIEAVVRDNIGREIEVLIRSRYVMLTTEFEGDAGSGLVFLGDNAVRTTIGGTPIEVTGATLTFRDDFIRRCEWELYGGDMVLVDLFARAKTIVSAEYLGELFDRCEDAFQTYILGGDDAQC